MLKKFPIPMRYGVFVSVGIGGYEREGARYLQRFLSRQKKDTPE
jgi:hypothetical protein